MIAVSINREKSPCITANDDLSKQIKATGASLLKGCALRTWSRNNKENRIYDHLEIRKDKKSNALTSKEKNTMACKPLKVGTVGKKDFMGSRVYSVSGKSVCLLANGGVGAKTGLYKIDLPDGDYYVRKLTPLECERLQTLPDNFTNVGISNTQRYKCLGNAWTVDVIAHILSFIK